MANKGTSVEQTQPFRNFKAGKPADVHVIAGVPRMTILLMQAYEKIVQVEVMKRASAQALADGSVCLRFLAAFKAFSVSCQCLFANVWTSCIMARPGVKCSMQL